MADVMTHDDSAHSIDSLVQAAREALTEAGGQWTAMRETVFRELSKHQRPVSAYDIADSLSTARGKRVAPNSIYRILDLFVASDLAMRIESANAYIANSHPGSREGCIFLVCDRCGKASHVHDAEVIRLLGVAAESQHFKADNPMLEIRGLCQGCD